MFFQPIEHTGLWGKNKTKQKNPNIFSQLLNPTEEIWYPWVCTALGPLIGEIGIYHVSEIPSQYITIHPKSL